MSWDSGDLASGPIPLWHQIAERLRTAIWAGEFRPGDALPSEAELNRRFGVSRTTARTSLDRLKEDGLISRRSGKGSIVIAPNVEQPLDRLSSFSDDMRRRGLLPSYLTESVRRMPTTRKASTALGIGRGDEAVRIKRRLLADGYLIGISDSWLAPSIVGKHELPDRNALDAGSLYDWLRDTCGARIGGGQELIGAAAASAKNALALDVRSGSPLLVAERTCRAIDGSPIEHATVHYRPDRYRFRVELVNPCQGHHTGHDAVMRPVMTPAKTRP